jgi:hypothetical protein
MKAKTLTVKTGSKEKGNLQEWTVETKEFDSNDIGIVLTDEAKAELGSEEAVLKLINSQFATNAANDSRRERTAGGPKRIETEGMLRVLMSMGKTEDEAKALIEQARKS